MRFTIYAPTVTRVQQALRGHNEGNRWKRLGMLRGGRDTGLKSGVNEKASWISNKPVFGRKAVKS
jgi:hypothetical protein